MLLCQAVNMFSWCSLVRHFEIYRDCQPQGAIRGTAAFATLYFHLLLRIAVRANIYFRKSFPFFPLSPCICRAFLFSLPIYKATLYGSCISTGGTPCCTHIIWSGGIRARRPEITLSKRHTHTFTEIHICLLRSSPRSFIFYSKVLSRNKKNWTIQSEWSDGEEGGLCVCVCRWWWCWRRICKLIVFSLRFACCWQGGGPLITFLVVFTNVSFIKLQQPQERHHHPSAKVEVIIALNHLTAYLFGRLSQADRGQTL